MSPLDHEVHAAVDRLANPATELPGHPGCRSHVAVLGGHLCVLADTWGIYRATVFPRGRWGIESVSARTPAELVQHFVPVLRAQVTL